MDDVIQKVRGLGVCYERTCREIDNVYQVKLQRCSLYERLLINCMIP